MTGSGTAADIEDIGGLVGWSAGEIRACYSTAVRLDRYRKEKNLSSCTNSSSASGVQSVSRQTFKCDRQLILFLLTK